MGHVVHTLTNRRWKEPCIAYCESHDQVISHKHEREKEFSLIYLNLNFKRPWWETRPSPSGSWTRRCTRGKNYLNLRNKCLPYCFFKKIITQYCFKVCLPCGPPTLSWRGESRSTKSSGEKGALFYFCGKLM